MSSPAGIKCGKACSHRFTYGTAVTLRAKAAKGSSFRGWSGGCEGRRSCKVVADEAIGITAKFTLRSCVVPRVTGKTLSAAKHALRVRFCRVGTVGLAFSGRVPAGRVISQRPKPGTRLRHGGKVDLTISRG
jgi:hypothetical protein